MLLFRVILIFVCASALSIAEPAGYHIETIETPEKVPFHVTGLDISDEGVVYCATRFGDVWVYRNDKWKLFASGLHEPCGLVYEGGGKLLVTQKPELTRLKDLNGDDVADEYINISNAWEFHDNYHEYNYGGIKDKDGNIYGVLNLAHGDKEALKLSTMVSSGGYRGWAYKVTQAGEFIPYASGLRSPAGIGMSPTGEIFYTDNQGDFVGSSKMHLIREGEFYGHPVSLQDRGYTRDQVKTMKIEDFEKIMTPPVLWIPHDILANSPGNPEWDLSGGKFGPFENQIFVPDQTKSNIFRVILQKVGDSYQGVAINFLSGFQSGNIRAKFSPDGELWVGQTSRGWESVGRKQFGLQKVVWDGTMPFEILDVKVAKDGFKLRFTKPIETASLKGDEIKLKHFWYKYSEKYGSPRQEPTDLAVKNIEIAEDGLGLSIRHDLLEGKVYELNLSAIKSINNEHIANPVAYYTLNKIPE